MRKAIQLEQIRRHLEKDGHITSWEAIQKYHVTRLSEYIYLLRKEWGFDAIGDVWVHTSNGNKFKRYIYRPENKVCQQ